MFRLQLVNDMDRMQRDMDQLFQSFGFSPVVLPRTGRVPFKVREHSDHYTVEAVLPGIDSEQLDINVLGHTLTISGAFRDMPNEQDHRWIRRERRQGRFEQTLELPDDLDNENIEAGYSHGILEIRLPKAAEVLPKKISIKAA